MTTSTSNLKLIIKAANQRFDDFIIDYCRLEWSIKHLKEHLNQNYPKNPDVNSIRLIYSGKLLLDHLTLKECIRHNSENTSHIIHLVHSSNNMNNINEKIPLKTASTSSTNSDENDVDLENELTPGSSSNSSTSASTASSSVSSSSSSSTSSINASPILSPNTDTNNNPRMNPFSSIQNDLNNLYQQQQRQHQQLTPKEQYNQLFSNLTRYYESLGIQISNNPWFSTYVQHLALYNHMYSNYMQSVNSNLNESASNLFQSNFPNVGFVSEPTISTASSVGDANRQQAPAPPPPQPQPQAPQRNQQNNEPGEREDDWLSILNNIVSFLVLFSVIYYYSSLERFLIIFTIAVVLIMYHNGWLSLQRRQVNANPNRNRPERPQAPAQNPQQNAENNENENRNNDSSSENDAQQQQTSPNIFRLILTFVFTFFTSLIPERPRVIN